MSELDDTDAGKVDEILEHLEEMIELLKSIEGKLTKNKPPKTQETHE